MAKHDDIFALGEAAHELHGFERGEPLTFQDGRLPRVLEAFKLVVDAIYSQAASGVIKLRTISLPKGFSYERTLSTWVYLDAFPDLDEREKDRLKSLAVRRKELEKFGRLRGFGKNANRQRRTGDGPRRALLRRTFEALGNPTYLDVLLALPKYDDPNSPIVRRVIDPRIGGAGLDRKSDVIFWRDDPSKPKWTYKTFLNQMGKMLKRAPS